MEILAPVKDMQMLKLAINTDIDAVYFAGPNFGARKNADNTIENTIEMIQFAKLYDVKAYITVNTLIYENEQNEVLAMLDKLYLAGADAFIIQDFGLLCIARLRYPDIEMHASTQMHVDNSEAAKLIEKVGADRVVVPRELNLSQISAIKENTNLKVEAFVHGALCTSYSGQCLVSQHVFQNSGNRGACNQNCRMKWDVLKNNKKQNKFDYNMSLKDLNSIETLNDLAKVKIDSLKIEGRLKRFEYVGVVGAIYKKYAALADINQAYRVSKRDYNSLLQIYNRDFTPGLINEAKKSIGNPKRQNHHGLLIGEVTRELEDYIVIRSPFEIFEGDNLRFVNDKFEDGLKVDSVNNISRDIYKVKTKKKIYVGAQVYKTVDIQQLEAQKEKLNAKINQEEINVNFTLLCDNHSYATFTYKGVEHSVESEFIATSSFEESNDERVLTQLLKTGNSPFKFNVESSYIEEGFKVKISELNNFRRQITDLLTTLKLDIDKREIVKVNQIETENEFDNALKLIVEVKTVDQAKAALKNDFSTIYLNNLAIIDEVKALGLEIIPVTPKVVEEEEIDAIAALVADFDTVMVSELGMLHKLEGKKIILNHNIYVTNSWSKNAFANHNVIRICESYEHDLGNEETIIYGKKPLMIMKYCPITNAQYSCDKCTLCTDFNYKLVDKYGFAMDLIKETPNTISCFSSKAVDKIDDEFNDGYNIHRVVLTNENYDQAMNILQKI